MCKVLYIKKTAGFDFFEIIEIYQCICNQKSFETYKVCFEQGLQKSDRKAIAGEKIGDLRNAIL